MLHSVFKVRFSDFQLDSPIAASRASPPFVLRVRVDDQAFNTTACLASTMRPMWDDVVALEYVTPSIEQLTTRYLVIECYGGGDAFLGSCRLALYEVATGPVNYHLDLKQGARDVGKINFRCRFELISEVAISFSRLQLDSLPQLGYDGNPNAYLSFHVGAAGDVKESSIAAGARAPQWAALPPLYFRGTYTELCTQRITIALRHCRNGFSTNPSDPTMAHVVLPLDRFPIEPRMCSVPFRELAHNDPGFPFPFNADMTGVLEFRNVHSVMQLAEGVRQDTRVVGGVPAVAIRSGSPVRSLAPASAPMPLPATARATSPPRHQSGYQAVNMSAASSHHHQYSSTTSHAPPPLSFHQTSQYVPPSQVAHYPTAASSFTHAPPSVPLPAVSPADLEVLDEVTHKQTALLTKIEGRLLELSRRKADVTVQIANAKESEERELEAASARKLSLDGDLRNALLEKDRLEEHLRSIQHRREEESRLAVQQAAERDRAKRALEEEQQEALVMQQRVVQLRNEMTRHLEEEEHRYQQRVREAEEARRRTDDDARALGDLEARLAEAELRATVRHRDEQHRNSHRTALGSPRRR